LFITWADFARSLRQELRSTVATSDGGVLDAGKTLELFPLVLTLAAVEHALLGIRRELLTTRELQWSDLEPARTLKRYLETSR
jgi:hypothetical protein